MSDISIQLSAPVVLAVLAILYWPVGLIAGLGLAVAAVALKGVGRGVCAGLAVAIAAAYAAALFLMYG
ncbi:hypothetical protein ACELLULO517_27490 [Acidisoma cellulosilytica]|uniref:Uncharacterized protein n=1 Tax=Acidisoma cellulosilyticum TaxID=2802395 RepID=A0A964E6Q5_9PROT|nr:hypothetical protein [Acidisoma cellulosilyticum]MCB8884010.1 hypothetical protein [Acidisoma cellulosilyticum]